MTKTASVNIGQVANNTPRVRWTNEQESHRERFDNEKRAAIVRLNNLTLVLKNMESRHGAQHVAMKA